MKHYEFIKVTRDGKTFLQKRLVGRKTNPSNLIDVDNDSITDFYKKLNKLSVENTDSKLIKELIQKRLRSRCNISLSGKWNSLEDISIAKNIELCSKEVPEGHILSNTNFNSLRTFFSDKEEDNLYAYYVDQHKEISFSDSFLDNLDIVSSKKKIRNIDEFRGVFFHELGHSIQKEMESRLVESVDFTELLLDSDSDEEFEIDTKISLGQSKFIEFSKLCGWDYSEVPITDINNNSYSRYEEWRDQRNIRSQLFSLITDYAELNPTEAFAEYYSAYTCNKKHIDRLLNGEKVETTLYYRGQAFDILQHGNQFNWIRHNLFEDDRISKSLDSNIEKSLFPEVVDSLRHILENKKKEFYTGCLLIKLNYPDWDEFITNFVSINDLYQNIQKNVDGYETEPHVTVLYGLNTKLTDIDRLKNLISSFLEDNTLNIGSTEISIFEKEEYDVVKFSINTNTKALFELNKLISEEFDFQTQFIEYQPHCTIAYVRKGEGEKYKKKLESPIFFNLDQVIYSTDRSIETTLYEYQSMITKSNDIEISKILTDTKKPKLIIRSK